MDKFLWVTITVIIYTFALLISTYYGKIGGFILWRVFLSFPIAFLAFYLYENYKTKTENVFMLIFIGAAIIGSAWMTYAYWGI